MKTNTFAIKLLLMLLILSLQASGQETSSNNAVANTLQKPWEMYWKKHDPRWATDGKNITTNHSAPHEIRTLDGQIYKSVHVVKYEADGIVIKYVPSNGGIGMTKIKFENLPTDLRQKYTKALPANVIASVGEFKEMKAFAEKGDIEAQYNLGVYYDAGYGVAKNPDEAVKWFRMAACQGSAEAEYYLGCICWSRPDADYAEVAKWDLKAANQGLLQAQFYIGVLSYTGKGIPKNFIEAYKWFNLASSQGSEEAKKLLLFLDENMSPDEITEARRLSTAFVPKKEMPRSNFARTTSSDDPIASGSAFLITDDGYLITNYHVVKDAAKVRLQTSSGTIAARVVRVDERNDIALLKAIGKFSALPILSSRSAHLGGTVATVGFPDPSLQGFSPKLAKGEIASLSGASDDPRYFQISVPVQPGNSGGALVDEHGNVIGIVSAKLDASVALAASGALPENVNYAVKSSLLLNFLESVPEVSAKLKQPNTVDEKFEDVVKSAEQSTVLVLVY